MNGAAITSFGEIVGSAVDAQENDRAVVFLKGKTVDLNSLINAKAGYSLDDAIDVNSHGIILARGLYNGRPQAFVLTPQAIPLPAPSGWQWRHYRYLPSACALCSERAP